MKVICFVALLHELASLPFHPCQPQLDECRIRPQARIHLRHHGSRRQRGPGARADRLRLDVAQLTTGHLPGEAPALEHVEGGAGLPELPVGQFASEKERLHGGSGDRRRLSRERRGLVGLDCLSELVCTLHHLGPAHLSRREPVPSPRNIVDFLTEIGRQPLYPAT